MQLGVERLSANTQQIGGGGAIITRPLKCCFDAQSLDHLSRFPHKFRHRYLAYKFCHLLDGRWRYLAVADRGLRPTSQGT